MLKVSFWTKAHPMRFVNVAIPSPIQGLLTYGLPEGMEASVGMRVEVPFRNRRAIGLVLEMPDGLPDEASKKTIKEVTGLPDDAPVMNERIIELIGWMSSYYMTPIGEVVRASLPGRLLKVDSPKTTRPNTPREISPIATESIELNADQRIALERILASKGSPHFFLLHGITGSGKTEVYLRLFEELAKEGRQGLLLVPEIGLTQQLTGRAVAKFGERVAVYHSGLTDAQRHEQWQRMTNGSVDVVIGTRSALFAPLPNLGAIVIDEEHDSSYKQDDGFSYHGRDCAVMRAKIEGIPAVLGSATPSLESVSNAKREKYVRLSLPSRTGASRLPEMSIVDMRERSTAIVAGDEGIESGLTSLSPMLYKALAETLDSGEQALLFLGRRGFSAIHCEACGEAIRCPNCDIALTSHVAGPDGRGEKLVCHYCDYAIAPPASCPKCNESALAPVGKGTQRLEAEIADFFPKARIARLDSDMAASHKKRHSIFEGMRSGKIDILVGTQMVTKGHDFPGVTLVGVISADQSLHLPDFRAAERTFQLLTQVAGRAGRASRPGRVIIQTFEPGHPSLELSCSHDFDAFASMELACREKLSYPPFSRLANVRFSSLDRELVSRFAHDAAEILRKSAESTGVQVLGPAPSPMEKLRGRFRWQLLLKAPSAHALCHTLVPAKGRIDGILPRKVRLNIDVDPTNML